MQIDVRKRLLRLGNFKYKYIQGVLIVQRPTIQKNTFVLALGVGIGGLKPFSIGNVPL